MNRKESLLSIFFWLILIASIVVRVIGLDKNPAGLYWEEVALGYDAYSIASTGHDHHGNLLPLLAFESFGDWKPSLYFYALVPFVKFLGLSAWSVRLPSAILGVLIVFGVYRLLMIAFKKRTLALWGMFFTAFSPWAIQFSRGGWETNLATTLVLWGVIFLLQSLNYSHIVNGSGKKTKINWFFISGVLLLILSTYAYHAARVVAPLLGLYLGSWYLLVNKKKLSQVMPTLTLALLGGIFLFSPFIFSLKEPALTTRFAQTSIFSQPEPVLLSNQCRELNSNSVWSKIICHRYLFYTQAFLENYFSHLNIKFLFLTGDSNLRHSTGFMGIFYLTDFFLLIAGACFLFEQKNKIKYFFLFWLFIGIIPSGLSLGAPHALRILNILPVSMSILAGGALFISEQFKAKLLFLKPKIRTFIAPTLIVLLTLGQFLLWLYHYVYIYPQTSKNDWQVGYKQMLSELKMRTSNLNQNEIQQVYITREAGRPAMYYWFYNQTDPSLVQTQNSNVRKDQGEYLEFKDGNLQINFVNTTAEIPPQAPALIVASPSDMRNFTIQHPENNILNTDLHQAWEIAIYQPAKI